MVKGLKKYQIDILKPLVDIARIFGIKVRFFKQTPKNDVGWTFMVDNKVHVPVDVERFNEDYQNIYSNFFHEMVHVLNYQEGYYPAYHNPKANLTKKQELMKKRTALRAEMFTDKRAKMLMKSFFPKLKFSYHYRNNKKSRKFLYDLLSNNKI